MCGKLMEEIDSALCIDSMEFCKACLSSLNSDIKAYVKDMGADVMNDKCAAFIVRAYTVLSTHVVHELRAEAEKTVSNANSAGFAK
jgi:hypothetical protein